MDLAQEALEAAERIRPYIRETYGESYALLQADDDTQVTVKLENLQHTGSFKMRGALNTILSLTHKERARGVVTASTGNHGAAVAYALGQLDSSGLVFVPPSIPEGKRRRIEQLGAEVQVVIVLCGGNIDPETRPGVFRHGA